MGAEELTADPTSSLVQLGSPDLDSGSNSWWDPDSTLSDLLPDMPGHANSSTWVLSTKELACHWPYWPPGCSRVGARKKVGSYVSQLVQIGTNTQNSPVAIAESKAQHDGFAMVV